MFERSLQKAAKLTKPEIKELIKKLVSTLDCGEAQELIEEIENELETVGILKTIEPAFTEWDNDEFKDNQADYVSIWKVVSENQACLLSMAKSILSVDKEFGSPAIIKLNLKDDEGFGYEKRMTIDELLAFAKEYNGKYRIHATVGQVTISLIGGQQEVMFLGPKKRIKQAFKHFELV